VIIMSFYYRWSYNHREGGADVYRFTSEQSGPGHEGEWVALVANGLVAQAMCNWLASEADPLPLNVNPVRIYARP
jgi:hypothetical protein